MYFLPPTPSDASPPAARTVQEDCDIILIDLEFLADGQSTRIAIPLPDDISAVRIGCLDYFLNKALQQWLHPTPAGEAYDKDNYFDSVAGGGGHVTLITTRPLTERDVQGISKALDQELDNFREGWIRKRRPLRLPWAEKSFTAPESAIKDWSDEAVATANANEAALASLALSRLVMDLGNRGIFHCLPYCGVAREPGSDTVTITGSDEIEHILTQQLGVRHLESPQRGR